MDVTLGFPFFEIIDTSNFSGTQDPADGLLHGDEVVVSAVGSGLDPVLKDLQEVRFGFKVGCGEMKSKRSSVGAVMVSEIVVQESDELLLLDDVGARVDVVTSSKFFIEQNVVTSVQLIEGNLPNREWLGWAVLISSKTLVGDTVVKSVRPDWETASGGSEGRIVEESPFVHHLELLVSSGTSVGNSHSKDVLRGDIGEFFHDDSTPVEFGDVVLCGKVSPVYGVLSAGNGVDRNFVSSAVKFLNGGVVCEGVRDEESGLSCALVALVLGGGGEDVIEDSKVPFVDGTAEGDQDHLRCLIRVQTSWDQSSVNRAKATFSKDAGGGITSHCTVGVEFGGANVLIGSICAVDFVVTENSFGQTFAGAALNV